jgi:hypothetical protein
VSREGEKQLQTNDSPPASADASLDRIKTQKELVEKLKAQWKLLWSERFNDKVRAEGISISDYTALYIERGTIIHATRDFKALSFKEILEKNIAEDTERFVQPNVDVGGWNKFVKTKITNHRPQRNNNNVMDISKKPVPQQPKKGGRGWLHAT